MKKNIFYMIACGVMVLAAAACSKEQANNEPQEEPAGLITESLSAQKESEATKVTLDGATLKFGWSDQDIVAFTINDGSDNYSFAVSDYYGQTVANKFTVSYTGTREGYAVLPAIFRGSYNGAELVVNYPTTYDISSFVDAGIYDNANGSAYIRFPMVATSTSGSNSLTFYSIGALVKVTMNHIPKGTKKVYLTFNQTVTGNFSVANPGTITPSVTVSDTATPSTVEIKISEDGLTAERNIVLYIPVPTTTGLEISSSTETKATVARNYGYAWSVDAITRIDVGSSFYWSDKDHELSPGNLWAHNEGGVVTFSFMSGVNQLCTTKGGFPDDPHVDANTTTPSRANDGEYQDVFTWNDLYEIMKGEAAPSSAAAIDTPLNIDGNDWFIYRATGDYQHFFNSPIRSRANTVNIRDNIGKVHAYVTINVAGTDHAVYALYESDGSGFKNMISGRLVFPDGFINQTDWITDEALNSVNNNCELSYDAFKKMVNAGAIFFIQGGNFYNGHYVVNVSQGFGYHTRTTAESDPVNKSYYFAGRTELSFMEGSRDTYRFVRLMRTVNP